MRPVLMIAFHYPPCSGSSGILRTLKFSRYLPGEGWRPIVLTAHPRAYERTGPQQLEEIPSSVLVKRAFALDTSRHLAIRGSSPRLLALPDRWVSWWAGAVPAGIRLIRRHRPRVIWSTYPIATAHLIGLTLHRLTGLPWVADFRDSMTEENYPRHPLTRRAYLSIERRTIAAACRTIFTAPSTRRMYLDRYPTLSSAHCLVIPNGYAEEDFQDFPDRRPAMRPPRPLRLLHSGLVYPEERDPRPLLRAVARLKQDGRLRAKTVRLDLRAAGSEDYYAALIRELDIGDIVCLLPPLPYRDSLRECAEADGLLLLQGPTCDHQIPAKVYEYLRLRRPILALTSQGGDTAGLLDEVGGATVVDLLDEEAIYAAFPAFLDSLRTETHPLPDYERTKRYGRDCQARELAQCFAQLI